jgi:hypothetical protein
MSTNSSWSAWSNRCGSGDWGSGQPTATADVDALVVGAGSAGGPSPADAQPTQPTTEVATRQATRCSTQPS